MLHTRQCIILQDALELMSVIAVMVNCALVGISGLSDRLFPELTLAERIVFIVILEVNSNFGSPNHYV